MDKKKQNNNTQQEKMEIPMKCQSVDCRFEDFVDRTEKQSTPAGSL